MFNGFNTFYIGTMPQDGCRLIAFFVVLLQTDCAKAVLAFFLLTLFLFLITTSPDVAGMVAHTDALIVLMLLPTDHTLLQGILFAYSISIFTTTFSLEVVDASDATFLCTDLLLLFFL